MIQTKIYCTKCGREIKDGQLYCDRCGQSVKKSMERQGADVNRLKEIERIQAENRNRRQIKEEKELKKQESRKKARKHIKVILFILGILLVALISTVVSYFVMLGNSPIQSTEDVIENDIISQTEEPKNTQQTTGMMGDEYGNIFKTIESNGITCPYPSNFTVSSSGVGEIMHLNDSVGGAVMVIKKDTPKQSPKELMLQCASELGGTIKYSRAGDDYYSVTTEVSNSIIHRKYVMKNGVALYYEFTYGIGSPSVAVYENCIKNLDENFNANTVPVPVEG